MPQCKILASPQNVWRPASKQPISIFSLSDIRTKEDMLDGQDAVPGQQENQFPCSKCQCECPDPVCARFTSQCTDQCIVVPCTAPHEENSCDDIICDDSDQCAGASPSGSSCIDDFLQCCDEYHAYLSDPKASLDLPTQFTWEPSFDAILANEFSTQQNQQQDAKSAIFAQPNLTPGLPDPLLGSDTHSGFQVQTLHNNPSFHLLNNPPMSSQAQPQQLTLHSCMWGDCKAMFPSLETLVSHVNLHHLRFTPPNHPNPLDKQIDYMNTLSCHWGDCQLYPTPASVLGSSGKPVDAAIGVLASHLFHDHLGLHVDVPGVSPPTPSAISGFTSPITPSTPAIPLDSHASISDPPTPPAEHDCSISVHLCRWKGCLNSFDTCEALMEHINTSHVGSGQKHYDCYWDECKRNGEHGFPSKQKICRHLQSHTGHRPYQCKICKQNFSEAATLQQHMRRHTQEKPYVCDFDGCGKAFAIAGALTIHKRTHNGHKPFKCTHCEKAFAESSNLSKHLRTHTGARPYACTEPGCGKSFARGDQLSRHTRIHTRKNGDAITQSPAPE